MYVYIRVSILQPTLRERARAGKKVGGTISRLLSKKIGGSRSKEKWSVYRSSRERMGTYKRYVIVDRRESRFVELGGKKWIR